MKTDLEMSAGISPVSYISFRRDVSFSTPYSSKNPPPLHLDLLLHLLTDLIFHNGRTCEVSFHYVMIVLSVVVKELHRAISLMSHMTKILLRVVMMRIRSKIEPEIADEQYGFVEGKGTTNAIYTLRMLIQRAIEVQKDVYLCFIDYTKAFDRVRHDEIMKDLTQIKIDGKDLRVIKNI
ncbi:endonuclease-reverse transcriptase [Elysia marginata]|uniref:Endonuclease-reverse transcriptase n=1 Tax=Elysia marginata TaxID=1093978 RepID=A0AAV4F331_9GAST|nr:endonuclease-reverse transcriptase [Elysia marginata]